MRSLVTCNIWFLQLKLADQILAEDKHQPMYKVISASNACNCF